MRFFLHIAIVVALASALLTSGLSLLRAQGPSTAMFLLAANSTLGFGSRGTPDIDIMRYDHDGTNPTPLIADADVIERMPHWSSDGRYIAYIHRVGVANNVAVYDTVAGTHTVLTDGQGYAWPQISPDGTRIAFGIDEFGVSRIATMNLDGTARQFLVNDIANQARPVWSPDGQYVLFQTFSGSGEVWRLDLQTGKSSYLFDGVAATYGADGRWLYYVQFAAGSPQIMRVSAANPTDKAEVLVVVAEGLAALQLAPSPDGNYIYYSTLNNSVVRVDVQTGDTDTFLQRPLQSFSDLAWSPLADEPLAAMPILAMSAALLLLSSSALWWATRPKPVEAA